MLIICVHCTVFNLFSSRKKKEKTRKWQKLILRIVKELFLGSGAGQVLTDQGEPGLSAGSEDTLGFKPWT